MNAYFTLHPWRNTRPLFFDVSLLGDASQFLLQPPDLLGRVVALGVRRRKLLLPFVERMLADAETLRNLRNRIASLRDLTHRVMLKIFGEIRFAHDALPASKLGKKASTNLGAIQPSA